MFKNLNNDSERQMKGPKRNPEKSGSGINHRQVGYNHIRFDHLKPN